jgi:hypothetical protein
MNYVHRREYNNLLYKYPNKNFCTIYNQLTEAPGVEATSGSSSFKIPFGKEMPTIPGIQVEINNLNQMLENLRCELLKLKETIDNDINQFVSLSEIFQSILTKRATLTWIISNYVDGKVCLIS